MDAPFFTAKVILHSVYILVRRRIKGYRQVHKPVYKQL